jgi:hypothetical protein
MPQVIREVATQWKKPTVAQPQVASSPPLPNSLVEKPVPSIKWATKVVTVWSDGKPRQAGGQTLSVDGKDVLTIVPSAAYKGQMTLIHLSSKRRLCMLPLALGGALRRIADLLIADPVVAEMLLMDDAPVISSLFAERAPWVKAWCKECEQQDKWLALEPFKGEGEVVS